MKNVYLMVYDLGGGHRSTANALREVIQKRKLPWQVHIVEFFQEIIGTTSPHYVYNNLVLKKKWAKIINEPLLVPSFKLQVRLNFRRWRSLLEQYWQEHPPDLVVSVLPYVNRLLKESLEKTFPKIPFVTAMTDFADVPPHFWIEPQKQFLICPSAKAVEQAKASNYAESQIIPTSGVVIHPRFNEQSQQNRTQARQSLGLDPYLPTGLVAFGTYGSKVMLEIAKNLAKSDLKLQLIFICGRNGELVNNLKNTPSPLPKFVEGFTKEIPFYMDLSDFFIGKPGSVGISEAIARKLPVITEYNKTTTLFQERSAAAWLRDNQFGIVLDNFRDINRAVAELIEPNNFDRFLANVTAYNNRAVFEVVASLEGILANSYSQAA